ncbi:hypothetical protein HMPREF3213_01673, partial [Heyndrickxia coagulans]
LKIDEFTLQNCIPSGRTCIVSSNMINYYSEFLTKNEEMKA